MMICGEPPGEAICGQLLDKLPANVDISYQLTKSAVILTKF